MASVQEVGGGHGQGGGQDMEQFVDAQQDEIGSSSSSDPKALTAPNWQNHSTPSLSQSNSSGRSSRGCTPPLAPANWTSSPHSAFQHASNSRSCSPSSKSLPKRSVGSNSNKSHKLESDSGFEVGAAPSESFLENMSHINANPLESGISSTPLQPSSSGKSLSKMSNHPSTSSMTSYGSEKRKKKSWMQNAINPTYRSRCEDLRKNFPGLPAEETLIVDYSCALQKDILVHGRLYVTTNFLCFYANIFRWETAVTIRWREVTAMTKEKTALVIPNAVQICTGNEKHFFTSFAARDKTHMMLFRLWQNALLDSPASQTEIWSWVQSVYGEQTNRYSDNNGDESNDGGSTHESFDGLDIGSAPSLPRPRLYSNIDEEEENKLPVNLGSFMPARAVELPHSARQAKSAECVLSDQSDFSESETRGLSNHHRSSTSPAIVSTDILTYEVWRQSKSAREIICRNFAINIDELFTLLFTNSKFFYDFQAERKTFDIVQCPWQHSDKSEDKFREVSYTLNLNHSIGPKTSRATEVQTMRSNSVPGHIYNVDVETTNADIPYADSFYVSTHYCVVKANESESLLTVLCDIKYKKTPWGLVKSFIEKNCWAGIEEHYAALAAGLDREIENRLEGENGKELVGIKKKTRRQRNQRRASASGESVGVSVPVGISQFAQGNSQPLGSQPNKKPSLKHDQTLFLVLLTMLGLLCLLNLFLIYKIWGLESKISLRSENFSSFQVFEQQQQASSSRDWLDVLHKQEILHNQELAGWRAAVEAASKLLQQTENGMLRLTQGFNRETNRRLLKQLLKLEEDTYGKAMFKDDLVEQEL